MAQLPRIRHWITAFVTVVPLATSAAAMESAPDPAAVGLFSVKIPPASVSFSAVPPAALVIVNVGCVSWTLTGLVAELFRRKRGLIVPTVLPAASHLQLE